MQKVSQGEGKLHFLTIMSEQNPGADRNFLNEILRNEPSLYDLHTHLLGMGDSDFWLYSVLGNERLLPTNKKICDSIDFRQKYGPLMWDDTKSKFINPECTDEFIRILINSNGVCDHLLSSLSEKETFRKLFKTIPFTELKHHNLTFLKDFSYDVILKLDNLAKAFGIFERNTHRDLLQTIVEEKLGFHDYKLRNSNTINNEFKYYIVFNARKQLFEIVYGIPVEIVRELVGGDVSDDKIQDKVILNARGYIRNAFSMRNADGTAPRMIDFSLFQGTFTPEFYPRRFALKDALYEQRLDILAYLLKHVLGRYISCAPPVKYCELSIGVGDLSRPWVFDILRSFSISDSIETNNRDSKNSSMINSVPRGIQKSTFKQLIGKYFQHLAPGSNDCFQDVTYKFLAGFSRHQVQLPYINSQAEAISLLYGAPQLCIHLMTKEMKREYEGGGIEGIFQIFVDQLNKMKQVAERHEETFYHWVVGLDLFGDESGYPYCPFVAHEFLAYIIHCRSINYYFGIRIHGGENVSVVNANLPGYRLFVAHMYIFFQSLQYLQKKLGCGIRIGHGIAFELILGDNGSITRERKSSVLLSEMQKLGKDVLKQITFEVNLTSNIYLLGTSVRQPLVQQKSHNLEILFNANIPVILATDDDGIWPINACPFGHNKHSSLPAEYCQAIDNKLIASTDQLKKMFSDTKSSAFWQPNHKFTPPPANNDAASFRPSFIVLHLDIVRHILRNFDFNTNSDQCYRFARYYEFIQQIQSPTDYGRDKEWEDQCESLSRTAFAACERWYLRKKRENIAVNPQHTLFLDDALYAELSWAALYKKFHQTATDLISQMFELGFKSLKKYHLFPSMYAVLRSTSNRKKVKEYFDTNSDELAVPIQGMVVDYNHHLLVCTQLEALDIQFLLSLTRRKELNIGNWTHTFSDSNKPTHFRFLSILDDDELPKELSFRVAYLLWMIICEEDPFKEKHILSLVNEIVG
ncbi:unnamed protein product, partial [Didymodactylos carnosus]